MQNIISLDSCHAFKNNTIIFWQKLEKSQNLANVRKKLWFDKKSLHCRREMSRKTVYCAYC